MFWIQTKTVRFLDIETFFFGTNVLNKTILRDYGSSTLIIGLE